MPKSDILGDFQIMSSKFYNFLVDFKTTFALLQEVLFTVKSLYLGRKDNYEFMGFAPQPSFNFSRLLKQ